MTDKLGFNLEFDDDIFSAMIELADELPALVLAYARKDIKQLLDTELLDQKLRVEPTAPVYIRQTDGTFERSPPMEWQSPLQRRAFFASNGFGGGIPYKRTHSLAQGWFSFVYWDREMLLIGVDNEHDATEFVYGPHYQMFHIDTGWPDAVAATKEFMGIVQDALIKFYLDAFEILGK